MTTATLPEVLHIRVTQDHIVHGEPDHCCLCPIALAITDAFPGTHVLAVQQEYVRLYYPSSTRVIFEPTRFSREAMRQFVETFDAQVFGVVEFLSPISLALRQTN